MTAGLITTALLWTVACDRLGLPYDQALLDRTDRCRVWDEVDRLRAEQERPSTPRGAA